MKSGRVREVREGGKAGVVEDAEGIEYPFIIEDDATTAVGKVVLFDLVSQKGRNATMANIKDQ